MKIKQLYWIEDNNGDVYSENWIYKYQIFIGKAGYELFLDFGPYSTCISSHCKSLDKAKEVCQKHFESVIDSGVENEW